MTLLIKYFSGSLRSDLKRNSSKSPWYWWRLNVMSSMTKTPWIPDARAISACRTIQVPKWATTPSKRSSTGRAKRLLRKPASKVLSKRDSSSTLKPVRYLEKESKTCLTRWFTRSWKIRQNTRRTYLQVSTTPKKNPKRVGAPRPQAMKVKRSA